ncbi:hypothetical protein D5018_10795 [Parashewanella curva]|uniref:Uncharacterized protein n=1 Tax=Parashewanella curva TaxID=2338552 RepID=A0A3L8PWP8_9GAMM|nr:hypothetical protein [Parashewanella curva]RLV59740.1 hypothetical protein D5018_10795 [Parashewanella curva]
MRKLLGLALFLGLISSANANYLVNVKLLNNAETIANPTLVVSPDKEVSVEVSKLYNLKLTVSPESKSTVKIATQLSLNGEKMSPVLITELGKPASIQVGNKEMSILITEKRS